MFIPLLLLKAHYIISGIGETMWEEHRGSTHTPANGVEFPSIGSLERSSFSLPLLSKVV
jgi:hypothetical protein